ncbi:hypothetical protein EUX98_g1472 [Antrodiella citrinella]|uniref:AMP-binding enzyme C-terminal domain-containing protein n=1 Tax=Antrodiella citrinella TaxID=2447956 RepID=A0A4V3XJE5_9APHY|nr:hypothetical protein EUX98_g1472 [Antrodiella citrinella]
MEMKPEINPCCHRSQTYGLTEANSISVSITGADYEARPLSTSVTFLSLLAVELMIEFRGLPSLVNDILIVRNNKVVSNGREGEIWLYVTALLGVVISTDAQLLLRRGPNVMKCYWRDPEATARALTHDGWLKTGDLGLLDKDGFLYIRDRIKDLINRGGEKIDSISVENAICADDRINEVAAVGVPDPRLGELVAAVISPKSAFRADYLLIILFTASLPHYAVPVMVVVVNEPFGKNCDSTIAH